MSLDTSCWGGKKQWGGLLPSYKHLAGHCVLQDAGQDG